MKNTDAKPASPAPASAEPRAPAGRDGALQSTGNAPIKRPILPQRMPRSFSRGNSAKKENLESDLTDKAPAAQSSSAPALSEPPKPPPSAAASLPSAVLAKLTTSVPPSGAAISTADVRQTEQSEVVKKETAFSSVASPSAGVKTSHDAAPSESRIDSTQTQSSPLAKTLPPSVPVNEEVKKGLPERPETAGDRATDEHAESSQRVAELVKTFSAEGKKDSESLSKKLTANASVAKPAQGMVSKAALPPPPKKKQPSTPTTLITPFAGVTPKGSLVSGAATPLLTSGKLGSSERIAPPVKIGLQEEIARAAQKALEAPEGSEASAIEDGVREILKMQSVKVPEAESEISPQPAPGAPSLKSVDASQPSPPFAGPVSQKVAPSPEKAPSAAGESALQMDTDHAGESARQVNNDPSSAAMPSRPALETSRDDPAPPKSKVTGKGIVTESQETKKPNDGDVMVKKDAGDKRESEEFTDLSKQEAAVKVTSSPVPESAKGIEEAVGKDMTVIIPATKKAPNSAHGPPVIHPTPKIPLPPSVTKEAAVETHFPKRLPKAAEAATTLNDSSTVNPLGTPAAVKAALVKAINKTAEKSSEKPTAEPSSGKPRDAPESDAQQEPTVSGKEMETSQVKAPATAPSNDGQPTTSSLMPKSPFGLGVSGMTIGPLASTALSTDPLFIEVRGVLEVVRTFGVDGPVEERGLLRSLLAGRRLRRSTSSSSTVAETASPKKASQLERRELSGDLFQDILRDGRDPPQLQRSRSRLSTGASQKKEPAKSAPKRKSSENLAAKEEAKPKSLPETSKEISSNKETAAKREAAPSPKRLKPVVKEEKRQVTPPALPAVRLRPARGPPSPQAEKSKSPQILSVAARAQKYETKGKELRKVETEKSEPAVKPRAPRSKPMFANRTKPPPPAKTESPAAPQRSRSRDDERLKRMLNFSSTAGLTSVEQRYQNLLERLGLPRARSGPLGPLLVKASLQKKARSTRPKAAPKRTQTLPADLDPLLREIMSRKTGGAGMTADAQVSSLLLALKKSAKKEAERPPASKFEKAALVVPSSDSEALSPLTPAPQTLEKFASLRADGESVVGAAEKCEEVADPDPSSVPPSAAEVEEAPDSIPLMPETVESEVFTPPAPPPPEPPLAAVAPPIEPERHEVIVPEKKLPQYGKEYLPYPPTTVGEKSRPSHRHRSLLDNSIVKSALKKMTVRSESVPMRSIKLPPLNSRNSFRRISCRRLLDPCCAGQYPRGSVDTFLSDYSPPSID